MRHVKTPAAAILLGSAIFALAEKPNVLLICVDDLKPALGCYGDTIAKTPQIDRLALRSTLFGRAYCNQAVCAPSRNALITGLRPDTLGIYDLETNFRKVAPDAVTMPQVFMKAGYRTQALGKILHTGHGNSEDAASWSMEPWKPKAPQFALPESTSTMKEGKNGARGAATESAEVADDFYADGKIADEAIARLKAAAGKPDEAFFLAVGFMKPHLPFVAPKKYWDLYERGEMPLAEFREVPKDAPPYALQFGGELRQYSDVPDVTVLPDDYQRLLIHGYYAATSYVDAQIGRVIDALDASGLSGNTIIVLWGDHGWHLGDHGMWCKHTNYEQAARIPLMIAKAGAKQGEGKRSDAFVETVDLFPTLCAMAGLAPAAGIDGTDIFAALSDPSAGTMDHAIHVYPRGGRLGRAIRTGNYRMVEWKVPGADPETAEYELYDCLRDPLEKENIAAKNPEMLLGMKEILARYPEAKPQFRAKGGKPATRQKPKQDRGAMFDSRDANKDGRLTMGEFLSRQPDGDDARPRFQKFDRDGDGFLSREEFVKP
ncbi:sulfatase-like hydrolase/transferase [Akkermansiaceae bacterium]|nr:sulfatase-like hydrolase/transferase [Akkermansiaceae bacterium]